MNRSVTSFIVKELMKTKKISAYVLLKPFGNNAEGDVIQIEEEEAQALVEAGVLQEATAEDVAPQQMAEDGEEEEEAPEQAAAYARAMDRVATDVAKRVTAKLGSKTQSPSVIPATVKGPVFKCMGEMLLSIHKARQGDYRAMRMLEAHQGELRRKAPLGSNETTDAQGGYAVKPEWYREIWDKVREYPDLMGQTERISINSDTLNIPALNETSLADGSRHGGIRAYWVAEGNSATSSYPALTQVQSVLNTQVVLVYVTNQLLQDANIEAFDQFINKKVGLEFAWQHNEAVCNGSGSSQPTGILNQAALITVAKESGPQTAATIVFPNLAKMYRALYPPSRANAVWLVNPEAYQQLVSMTFPTSSGTASAFGGLTFNAHDEFPLRIFGKPAIEVMNLPQLGNAGDIILCDLSQLVTAERPGVQADVSYEIQFTTLQTAFRFVRRYDIKSPWTAALTSVDGNYSYSPFVTLQSRGT